MNFKKSIFCIISAIVLIIAIAPKAIAANLTINFSSSQAKVGDTVTATVSGNGVAGKVNLSVSGNASLSQSSIFVDGSASVTVKINGEGNVKVTATAADMADTSTSQPFTGATAGTIKVSSNSSSSTSSDNKQDTSKQDNSKTSTKSNNTNLSNLGIKPNDFTGFKTNKTSYDVTVPNDVEKVTVYATAQDKKASIKGNGTQKLNVGKNTLNVVVTAEDGTQKTYTINVTREEGNSESDSKNETTSNSATTENTTTESASNENKSSDLKSLNIKGYTLNPTFSPDVYEYKVDVSGDVSSLDIETEGANHSVSVDIVGNENLTDGENTITILVYNEETKQNSTYQITVNKTSADVDGLNSTLSEAEKKAQKIRYIILGVVALIIIGIIVFIIVRRRYKKEDDEKYEYDEEDQERINLNDDDDFFSRVNREAAKKEEDTNLSNEIYPKNVLQDEEENQDETKSEYEVDDYYRTNKPRKRGKHF